MIREVLNIAGRTLNLNAVGIIAEGGKTVCVITLNLIETAEIIRASDIQIIGQTLLNTVQSLGQAVGLDIGVEDAVDLFERVVNIQEQKEVYGKSSSGGQQKCESQLSLEGVKWTSLPVRRRKKYLRRAVRSVFFQMNQDSSSFSR